MMHVEHVSAHYTTITGPVMGNVVRLTNSCVPTVVTIVNRKQLCRRRRCCC